MFIILNVAGPEYTTDPISWLEVEQIGPNTYKVLDTSKDESEPAWHMWLTAEVQTNGVGQPLRFHFTDPGLMAPGHWNTLGVDPATGRALSPDLPLGFTVKSFEDKAPPDLPKSAPLSAPELQQLIESEEERIERLVEERVQMREMDD